MKHPGAYKKTITAYKKIGKSYLKSIKDITPKQFFNFIKLLPKAGRVLDVGCAGGRDSKKFTQKGFEVIGIDLVDEFLDEAKIYAPKARFIKMDLLKMKFPKGYFDGIWASSVLVHIKRKDVPTALKNFYKILRAGGKIFIAVKSGRGSAYITDKLSNENRLFVYFSKEETKRLLNKIGFKLLLIKLFPDDAGRKEVKWIRIIAEKPV